MRVLIVGQAPSRLSDPREPLSGRSGRRLASLLALDLPEFLAAYDRVNLLARFPGKLSKGDAFPIDRARRRAAAILAATEPRRLVLLGRGVSAAFGLRDASLLAWRPLAGHLAAVCPHPSGVCLWWNDPRNVGQARAFWLALERARRP